MKETDFALCLNLWIDLSFVKSSMSFLLPVSSCSCIHAYFSEYFNPSWIFIWVLAYLIFDMNSLFGLCSCRQIKGNCAESFTEYWTCLDYTNLAELRHCRKQQQAFDSCVLDKLGWERPELGDLSKVRLMIKSLCIHIVSILVNGRYSCWLWAVQETDCMCVAASFSCSLVQANHFFFFLLLCSRKLQF